MIGRMLLMAIAIGIAQVAFSQMRNCLKSWEIVEGTEDDPTRCVVGKAPMGCSDPANCVFSFRIFGYVCCKPDPAGIFAASSVPGVPECCGQYSPVSFGLVCAANQTNQCPYLSECMESTNPNVNLCCRFDEKKNMTAAVC